MKSSRILAAAAAMSFVVVVGVPTDAPTTSPRLRKCGRCDRSSRSPANGSRLRGESLPGRDLRRGVLCAPCRAAQDGRWRRPLLYGDLIEKVRDYLQKEGKLCNGAWATVASDVVTVDGQVKIDERR